MLRSAFDERVETSGASIDEVREYTAMLERPSSQRVIEARAVAVEKALQDRHRAWPADRRMSEAAATTS